jgi:hypothetical protein
VGVVATAVDVDVDGMGPPERLCLPEPLLELTQTDGTGECDPRRQALGAGAARDRDRRDGAEREPAVRSIESPDQAVRAQRRSPERGVVGQPATRPAEEFPCGILDPSAAEIEPAALAHEDFRCPRKRARDAN